MRAASRGEGKRLQLVAALVVIAAACSEPRAAVLEQRVAPLVWSAGQELLAGDAAELDELGRSVSLAGDRALVGAYGERDARGAAYVFVRSGGVWTEEQKLVAGDGAADDKLGYAVSMVGDRALVGAYGAKGSRGAAYVFVRSGSAWTEEQKLVASDGGAGDNFGWSVALTVDRALVGASGSDSGRGAAHVFVRSGSAWTEEQKLVASDGAVGDSLGVSVALSGDRAAVGAPGNDGYRGAARIYVRNGSATQQPWTEEQKLVASDGAAFDDFGNAVSLAADRMLVGSYWNDDFRGAAYVYLRNASATARPWTEEQKLVASDAADGARFAGSVSLSTDSTGDRALVGALGPGAAYVFVRTGSSWSEEQRLIPGGVPSMDLFGWSVSLAADRALVGASYTDQLRGAAWMYTLVVQAGDAGADAEQDADPIDAGVPGPAACVRGDECASGHCEDGLCCDRACAASERCQGKLKVSGDDGVCGPAMAAVSGQPCRFDVQCTSGHCSGANGICSDADAAPDASCTSVDACMPVTGEVPGDDPGCGCRAGRAPTRGASDWLGLALALLLLRTGRGRRPPQPHTTRSCGADAFSGDANRMAR